jgi:DNA-binding transcriptional LysR family regulator
MDLRHLRYFIAVAENLSFTRAAERLHIAQPPLSQQIRQLEEELGVTLLHRTRRHVELSDAGRVFLEQAKQIIRATEMAAVQAQRAQRGEIGRLAVGFFEHMSYTLLPPILRAYRERFPSVDVQLRWFPVISQADALLRGDVDVSFMRPVPQEEVIHQTLLKEPFVLAVPDSHPLAKRQTLSLKECAAERFIMYVPQLAPDFHTMIMRMCAASGFVPDVALEVGQVYTTLGLVSSGTGLAFVPSSVQQRVRFDHVVYKPIRGRTPKIEVMLGWVQRNPSPLLTAFVQTAKEVVASLPTRRGEAASCGVG